MTKVDDEHGHSLFRPDQPQRRLPPEGFASARRCTCSICRMRGAVTVTSTPDQFRIIEGEDKLATYRFNSRVAEHHFCSVCGIYTHHKRRSNPNQLGVNVACLEGVSPFDFAELIVFDGTRHPRDNPDGKASVAGVLTFEPAEPAGFASLIA
jgi:hypothetical protein